MSFSLFFLFFQDGLMASRPRLLHTSSLSPSSSLPRRPRSESRPPPHSSSMTPPPLPSSSSSSSACGQRIFSSSSSSLVLFLVTLSLCPHLLLSQTSAHCTFNQLCTCKYIKVGGDGDGGYHHQQQQQQLGGDYDGGPETTTYSSSYQGQFGTITTRYAFYGCLLFKSYEAPN